MRVSSNDFHPSHGNSRPPLSHLGLRILRTDIAAANENVAKLTIQLREASQDSSRQPAVGSSSSSRHSRDIREGNSTDPSELNSTSQHVSPIYKELYDSASSIVTEILRHPRLLVDAIARIADSNTSSSRNGQMVVGFIAVNRILHPYFSSSSATTALLLEAIIHQTEKCQHQGYSSSDASGEKALSSSLFIEDPTPARSWHPLENPLPVTPNVQSEPVLTTLLKLYAVRVDVTSFFRELWIPVLPSVVAVIDSSSSSNSNSSFQFKSIVKVAMRLLSHTFSEKSIVSFPPSAAAVSRAIYALSGMAGLYSYVFDLLIFPNIVKILSLAEYDGVGGDVLKQVQASYSQKSWWPQRNQGENMVSSLLWVVWRLFSGAISFDSLQLSALSTRDFFSNGPALDLSSMPDQRLQYIVSTLGRAVRKSCQLLLHLPLDAKGCQTFDTDAASAAAGLKTTLPHLSEQINSRLDSLLERPDGPQLLVLSRYEASAVFDAISAAAVGEGSRNGSSSRSLLKEEIASYHLLEGMIQDTMPLSSQPVSEQMVLHLILGGTVPSGPEGDTEVAHSHLSRCLSRSTGYQDSLRTHLTRTQERRAPKLDDLLLEDFKAVCGVSSLDPSHGQRDGQRDGQSTPRQQQEGADELSRARTLTSALKVTLPHRGVVSVAKVRDRASQRLAEDEKSVLKKSLRVAQIARESQTVSTYSGSTYTKMDEGLLDSHLLDDTASRTYHMQVDSSPMPFSEIDKRFRDTLRSPAVKHGHGYYDASYTYPNGDNKDSSINISNNRSYSSSSRTPFSSNSSNLYNPQNNPQYNPRMRTPKTASGDSQSALDRSTDLRRMSNRRMTRNQDPRSSCKKQLDSAVKPFPEHLRVKMRQREKEFISPCSDQEDNERNHSVDRISQRKGLSQQQGSMTDDRFDNSGRSNREGGQGNEGERPRSQSEVEGGNDRNPADQYRDDFSDSSPSSSGNPRNQGPGSGNQGPESGDRYRYGTSDSRVEREDREERAEGRNLDADFHSDSYDHNDRDHLRPETVDLSDVEVLAAVNDYQPVFVSMRGRGPSDRYRGEPPDSGLDPFGYLDCDSQKSSYNLNAEGHLGGLEGRLYSKTKSIECRLSAAKADAVRPYPAFEQPVILPWKRERSQSADKLKGRTHPERGGIRSTIRDSTGSHGRSRSSIRSSPGTLNQHNQPKQEQGDIEAEIEVELRDYRRSPSRDQIPQYTGRLLQPTKSLEQGLATAVAAVDSLPPSPSFRQPVFKPVSRSSENPLRSGLGSGLGSGRLEDKSSGSRYSFSPKAISPSYGDTPNFLSPVRRDEGMDFTPRSVSRSVSAERVLRPSKPPGQRSSTRPLPSYKPSPSALCEAPSRFLREIHAGRTPGLREHEDIVLPPTERYAIKDANRGREEKVKEKEKSRRRQRGRSRDKPIFRPSGSIRRLSQDDYDGRIAESLSANNISEEANRYISDVDPGDSSDSSLRSPPCPPAYELYDHYDLDHHDIRAAALEVMMNMAAEQFPCGKLKQLLMRRDEAEKEEEEREKEEEEELFCERSQGGDMLCDRDDDYLRNGASEYLPLSSSAFRLSTPMATAPSDPLTSDPLTSDPVSEDPLSEDPLSEDPLSEDPLSEDPLPGDPLPGDPLTEDVQDDLKGDLKDGFQRDLPGESVKVDGLEEEGVEEEGCHQRDDVATAGAPAGVFSEAAEDMVTHPTGAMDSSIRVDEVDLDRPLGASSRAPIEMYPISRGQPIQGTKPTQSPNKGSPSRSGSASPKVTPRSDPIGVEEPPKGENKGGNKGGPKGVKIETSPSPLAAEPSARVVIPPFSPLGTEPTESPPLGIEPLLWGISPIPRSPTRTDSEVYDSSPVRAVPVEVSGPPMNASNTGVEMIRRGVLVTKHGTRGKSKRKLLRYFEVTDTLHWTSILKPPETVSPQGPGWFSQVSQVFSPGKEKERDSFVALSDITGVFDKDSKASGAIKKMIKNLSQNCCLLVTDDKTLDLTFKNAKEMSLITSALKELLRLPVGSA